MLLVGTETALLDLDADRALIEGVSVTAINGDVALIDKHRVVRIGDLSEVGTLDARDGQSVAPLPDGTVLVGRTGARLTIVSAGEARPVTSFEEIPGRDDWENPANPTPDTRTMTVDDRGRIFVNVHVGGLWLSDDRGTTWHGVVEPEADIHEVVNADGTVAVAAAVGFGWSDDGTTWKWTTDGLHASYARAVALDGDAAYVSAANGPFARQGAVYRARVGARFERCEKGLPEWFPGNVDSGCVAARAGRAAIGTETGAVYVSNDAGVDVGGRRRRSQRSSERALLVAARATNFAANVPPSRGIPRVASDGEEARDRCATGRLDGGIRRNP